MLGIYGLEATNNGFITLIKALCQQSFGLTLPQNCVRTSGHKKAQKFSSWSSAGPFFICAFFVATAGARRTLSRPAQLVRMDPGEQRGKKPRRFGPRRGIGRSFAALHRLSVVPVGADSTRKADPFRSRKQLRA